MKLLRQSVHRSLASGISDSKVHLGGQQHYHLSLIAHFLDNDEIPHCGVVPLHSWFLETQQSPSCWMQSALVLADGLLPTASCGMSCIKILLT